ncbi:hypothetical protein LCGC14_0119090 [marine sediment metagenome]|uniref:Polysaccharide biosynthesis protein C-terminal domain-containing protein n=1 Tax=marine sediment metagenome TaxID=412755 RepID=A0A0F9V7W1_9ZZZZ|nr:lipopolysaccharide biosynthesis protein [Maribacter sp.]
MFIDLIEKIRELTVIKNNRSKNIAKHLGWSIVYKVGSILANFLLVPITINYLSIENYGIWLTLTSFIAWFSFFDIGLGNGLRNKFAEAKATGNYKEAQGLVSTAYFTISAISIVLILLFVLCNFFIDWSNFFNTSINVKKELSILMPIVFAFFAIQLVLKLITTIYQADQNHSIQNKFQFFSQVGSVLIIWLLTQTNNNSLLIFGVVFSAIPFVLLLFLNFYAFNGVYKTYKPLPKLWKREYLLDISGLGLKFFVVQIAALILFSTDNYIITKLFSPEEVVPYNIAFKYYSIITMGYTILITPFWSSFTEAYKNEDFNWIKNSVKKIQKIWFLIPIALLVMTLLADWFYDKWVGDSITIPANLSYSMALFVAMVTFNMIYVNFINGVGKIKLQLYSSVVSMIINIPLSIFMGKNLGLGTTGVILATCICLSYSVFLWPIQYRKLIENKATGIWNQ